MSDQHHIFSREEELLPDVIKFLLGEGQLHGYVFGEYPHMNNPGIKYKHRYWWRSALREAWNTRPITDKPERLAECKADVEYWKHCTEFGSLSGKVALEQRIAECEQALQDIMNDTYGSQYSRQIAEQALAAKTVEEK